MLYHTEETTSPTEDVATSTIRDVMTSSVEERDERGADRGMGGGRWKWMDG